MAFPLDRQKVSDELAEVIEPFEKGVNAAIRIGRERGKTDGEIFDLILTNAGAVCTIAMGGVSFDDMFTTLTLAIEKTIRAMPPETQDAHRLTIIQVLTESRHNKNFNAGAVEVAPKEKEKLN